MVEWIEGKVKIGTQVTVWDGEGDIGKPSSWLIGVVVKTREGNPCYLNQRYQVSWNRFPNDTTWYNESDIHMRNLEGRFG